ncbi:uncharacterized protein LOC143362933 [Halictus rubicundus]|uniref:uncharacterized protein LOC143362933 n=1 Tax=Halictus rubicundus TaxID=77578 RepID=UPI004035F43E
MSGHVFPFTFSLRFHPRCLRARTTTDHTASTRTDARTQDPENTKHAEDTRRKELEAREKQITELELKATTLEKLLKEHACSKKIKDARNESLEDHEGWKKELELKNRRIAELETELTARRPPKNDACAQNLKLAEEKDSWRRELEAKDTRITQLEDELESLKSPTTDDNQSTRLKRPKENEGRTRECNESWKQEIEAKNRRIVELEQEMESLENFLREHADTESLRDLEIMVERKRRRIEELEDTVAEFEDFLKQNPDVKELHELRCQVTAGNRRIQELERWIQKSGENRELRIDQERIIELEEMVTQLEEYVRKHNVDGLKMKLQDRECKIEQLQNRVGYLEKELCKVEENCRGKEAQKNHRNVQDRWTTMTSDDLPCGRLIMDGNAELREKEQKMKKMEHAISEKDNKIQAYEQQIVECKDEITKLRKEVASLKKELSEYDDIGVLKEEIRVRDERIQQLEDEVDSLERAFSERIDLEQIEELVNIIKEKEDKERLMSKDLMERRSRIEELSEALRESVVITSESEKKWKNEEKMRKEALQRVAKLEQRITSMQSASALKCITCQPLLSKLQKYESRLEKLAEERTVQLEDLRQMQREALKAAVSEKDAHLALLELSGINNAAQSKQAEELKADRKRLLDTLKKEDEKSIELSAEFSLSGSEGTPHLLTRILETSDDDEEGISNDRRSDSSSPRPATRNGDSCEHSKRKSSKGTESKGRRDQPKIDQQDSR